MSISVKINGAYHKKNKALDNIEFSLENGTITAVIGRNGSGKSTLVSAICRLIKYDGKIMADGFDLDDLSHNERARLISVIFQRIKSPHITVKNLVSFGRSPYVNLNKSLTDTDISYINDAIKNAELTDIQDKYLDEISGGELKRAYFGMMLSQNTKNIILDEATAFMDRDYEGQFLDLIKKSVKSGDKCCIFIMHNLDNAIKFADNILILDNGKQIFFGTAKQLLDTSLIEDTFNLKRVIADNNVFFI